MQNGPNNGYGITTQQHQSEMLMSGLSNSYHHLNQPNPNGYGMDYGVSYSYYQQGQSDDAYPGMGEDAYTIKNSLCTFSVKYNISNVISKEIFKD